VITTIQQAAQQPSTAISGNITAPSFTHMLAVLDLVPLSIVSSLRSATMICRPTQANHILIISLYLEMSVIMILYRDPFTFSL
jgi:hypothetical protein